ncbi:DUF6886 family protein [Liberiplasma polymorphum]|uniref:DUF6886 family protein n=1 Tax=Liberiplasma polymorphum TaxID=3374570 RepID=UPI0037729CCD
MRLFHVSENDSIVEFKPIKPYRKDIDQSVGLVWAINERALPNFFTPRDCPRVTYHVAPKTTTFDKETYFSSPHVHHCIAIEHQWVSVLKNAKLTVYEFDPKNFILQDESACYYVSENVEVPIAKYTINDIFKALKDRNVEVKILPEIISLIDKIIHTSFYWSMCRMHHATPLNKQREC